MCILRTSVQMCYCKVFLFVSVPLLLFIINVIYSLLLFRVFSFSYGVVVPGTGGSHLLQNPFRFVSFLLLFRNAPICVSNR